MRGFGESTYNHKFESLFELSDDIAEFCCVLNLNKPVILGWSTGATVALGVASRHPELPRAIISQSGACPSGHKFPIIGANGIPEPPPNFAYTKDAIAASTTGIFSVLQNPDPAVSVNVWRLLCVPGTEISPDSDEFKEFALGAVRQRCVQETCWGLTTFNVRIRSLHSPHQHRDHRTAAVLKSNKQRSLQSTTQSADRLKASNRFEFRFT
jgi:pimeloyl-ACP methyl ester carboxylesterase